MILRPAVRLSALFVCLFVLCSSAFAANGIVISQVYGAGGNSGANLNQDYVELFNAGTSAVSINGWSIQYRSSASTSTFLEYDLPDGTIQPGHFYLIAGTAVGANGSALPTADATVSFALSGTAGQVLLSSGKTALTGCPPAGAVVDYVGFGSGTACSEGSNPTATLTTTKSVSRTNPCTDTDNNGNDFTLGADVPRNSSSTPVSCGGPATFSIGSTSATPSTVNIGDQTLLTATVTPGATSTGITVSINLSGVGGSGTQKMYDDGMNGDATAGDNIFSYQATIGSSAGTYSLAVTAGDTQLENATGSISLTTKGANPLTPIHTIQSNLSTYLNQSVTTEGVVTEVIAGHGFYLETQDAQQDPDPTTSEALFVTTTSASTSIAVGNLLKVTATVKVSSSTATYPATELGGTVTLSLVSTGVPLPTPVTLTASQDSPTGGFGQFFKYQSMLMSIPSFTVTQPTDGTLAEASETVTSNGQFWGVVTGVDRPFAEPGISVLEPSLPSGTPATVPRFDGNPELIFVDSMALGGSAIDVTSTQTISSMLGVFDFTSGSAVFRTDKIAPGTLGTAMTPVTAPAPAANEFTIATQNFERFYSDQHPDNSGTVLTTAAYQQRLAKASLYIRNVLNMPDIVAVEEIGQLATLQDIATKISSDAVGANQPDPHYTPYLVEGTDTINVGFLVGSRVTVGSTTQFGKTTTYVNSTGANAELNDRPPFVLKATVNVPGYTAYPVTVIVNHLKALTDVDDTTSTGANDRLKREAQAEYLANLVQGYQQTGDHVIVVGDMNAYVFNDGYVDTMGVVRGNPAPAGQDVITGVANLVTPNLTDLASALPAPLQYSYTYIGNAQILDHAMITNNVSGARLFYVHADADFPLIDYNDATKPLRVSDHDGGVIYFPLLTAGQTSSATLSPAPQDFGSVVVSQTSAVQTFTLTNTGNTAFNISSVTVTGDFAKSATTCGASLPPTTGNTCTVTVTFTPTATGPRTGVLTVLNTSVSNPSLMLSLSGTGAAANSTVTMTPSTANFSNVALGATAAAQVFTVTNAGNVSATLSNITLTGSSDFAKTTTCGASLPPTTGNTCTVSVTFAPSTVGAKSGVLSVTTSGSSSALTATLSGTGIAQTTVSPTSITFSGTTLTGQKATAQTVTVTNASGAALSIASSGIAITGDYTQTNTCGTSLASGGNCTISVVFAPTDAGTRTGSLTITTTLGTGSTTQTVSLTGTAQVPPDFTLTPGSEGGTLTAGTGASTTLTIKSVGGYSGTLNLTCSGMPTGSSCFLNPTQISLVPNPTTNPTPSAGVQVIITTSKAAGIGGIPQAPWQWVVFLVAVGSAMFAGRRKALRGVGLLVLLLGMSVFAGGCGGGNGASTGNFSGAQGATPAGNYTFTITVNDGTTSHSSTFLLTVQ